jgi:hypothetical protein
MVSLLPEAERESCGEEANSTIDLIQGAAGAASNRIQTGFQGLIFAVLIRAVLDDTA